MIIKYLPDANAQVVETIEVILCAISSVKQKLWMYIEENLLDVESISWELIDSSNKIIYAFVDSLNEHAFINVGFTTNGFHRFFYQHLKNYPDLKLVLARKVDSIMTETTVKRHLAELTMSCLLPATHICGKLRSSIETFPIKQNWPASKYVQLILESVDKFDESGVQKMKRQKRTHNVDPEFSKSVLEYIIFRRLYPTTMPNDLRAKIRRFVKFYGVIGSEAIFNQELSADNLREFRNMIDTFT